MLHVMASLNRISNNPMTAKEVINVLLFVGLIAVSNTHCLTADYDVYTPADDSKLESQEKSYWQTNGEEHLIRMLRDDNLEKKHVAKNVVIFVGDGMGLTTTTAARIYKGQRKYGLLGEEHNLSFEKFPNVALVKTYNVDKQVPDSAGTATALFSGVKTRSRMLGLDAKVNPSSFDKETYVKSKLDTIMVWAQQAGKHTGFVSNTKVTDATPAALYASISNREWECDISVPEKYRTELKDIARQLVENKPGKNFKVILGGGQQQMGYVSNIYPNYCSRGDHLNLTQVWLNFHNRHNSKFVVDTQSLNDVTEETEYLLGLFHPSHMPYEVLRNKGPEGTPSLSAMTKKAIQILKKGPDGFVLMVEGGLIDRAHHKNYARLAITEAAELDEAVLVALNETDSDTLILVTSDHSHSLTMNGYSKRGNDILGVGSDDLATDKPYLTLSYGNGPGFSYHFQPSANGFPWRDVSADTNRFRNPWYQHLATFFKQEETHGGEDVPIYAVGPSSHLVKGVIEQNVVALIISYAACIGTQARFNQHCPNLKPSPNLNHLVPENN